MPEDVDALLTELLGRPPGPERPGRMRSMDRLDGGVVALDCGDDGHVFELTVERIPRRHWAPERPVRLGHVDGVDVDLVGVTVDNFVHVQLAAAPTAERDRLTRGHHDAVERWAATAGQTHDEPPDNPAGRLMRITVRVDDALGTVYGFRVGHSGGTGTEWEATQSFRPRPPAEVRELHLTLQAPGQREVGVPVVL
jgi:hypothetical protein